MTIFGIILTFIGLWFFTFALGQAYQLCFAPLPGDEPIPAEYFVRHRKFIWRSLLSGVGLALGYWTAAGWCFAE